MGRIIRCIFALLIFSGCASKTSISETSTAQPSEIIKFGNCKKITKNGMGALPVSPRKFMKLVENSDKIAIKCYNHY